MPDIVEQRRCLDDFRVVLEICVDFRTCVPTAQCLNDSLGKIEYTQRVHESAMLGPMKRQPTDPQLTNSSQPLEFGRID